MSSFAEPSSTWTHQALGNRLDWCIEVLGTRHRQVRQGARNQGRWPRLWLVGARSLGVIAPGCLELTTSLWTYWVRSFPVWSELERRPGSELLELQVQGLSHRVVWRTHRVRPSPVRFELEWRQDLSGWSWEFRGYRTGLFDEHIGSDLPLSDPSWSYDQDLNGWS
jgi:hypothetical protein